MDSLPVLCEITFTFTKVYPFSDISGWSSTSSVTLPSFGKFEMSALYSSRVGSASPTFLLIILECLIIAYRAKTLSGRLICVGVMAWIGFQTYTNIAVATGLFPNTGITLPFFSRGVSSLLSVYFGFGIVLNVALQRKT